MNISYNWLCNYFEGEASPGEVSEILTDCGLEVEGFEKKETVKGGLEGVVIGKVTDKREHPDADRLNLTKVDVGEGEPLDIVCGAPNVEKGQTVVVAKVGATLYPAGTEEGLKIRKAKIRGEASYGMICAEDEIGMGDSHDGIMVIDEEVKPGTPARTYFNIEEDYIYDIGLTPNRVDAASHYGVARDLVAVLRLSGKNAELKKPSVADFEVHNNDLPVAVEVKDAGACPRYSGLTLSDVKVGESPDWLKNKLLMIGLTPVNNVVDVTNFVLHETGQPLHAFDASEISGNKVVVRQLNQGTKFTTLDGVERELDGSDLMICDGEKKGMCIAGVFGGESSGVTEGTRKVFLESAYFNPVAIRKTAKHHGLNTDASFRFERGADPNITIYALKRAAMLICELTGAKVSSEIVDEYPEKIEDFEVGLSYGQLNNIVGQEIDRDVVKAILRDLEILVRSETEEGLELSVPPYRVDVSRDADIIEEVMRIYGYNRIDVPEKLSASLSYSSPNDPERIRNVISDFLSSNGFYEMMANSLTSSGYYKGNSNWPESGSVEISNPLSAELDVMRQTLLYGALEAVAYNVNRQQHQLKLYEFGNKYEKTDDSFCEEGLLAVLMTGERETESWNTTEKKSGYYDLKGHVNAIVQRLGVVDGTLQTKHAGMEGMKYSSFLICEGETVGYAGEVGQSLLEQFDIDQAVCFAELNWDKLLKLTQKRNEITYRPVAKFPSVRRDLALLLDQNVSFAKLEEIAYATGKKLLKEVNLFDVYQGKNIEKGKKSYALSFIFLDEKKTLRDKQVDKIMDKLIRQYKEEVGAELR